MSRPETIRVWLGEGSAVDGGPFVTCEVHAVTDDVVALAHESGDIQPVSKTQFVRDVNELARSAEPYTVTGVPADAAFRHVALPLHDYVEVCTDGAAYPAEHLRTDMDLKYRAQQALRDHGGAVRQ